MKKFLVSMAVAALAIPALAQSSAPARVAVIDVNKVLSTSTAGKAAAARLKQLQEDKMSRAQKLDDEIKRFKGMFNVGDERQAA
jgi:Skp family chaperone for outer membrane proteins